MKHLSGFLFFSFFLVIGEVVRKKWLFSRNENNFTFKVEFFFFSDLMLMVAKHDSSDFFKDVNFKLLKNICGFDLCI